MQLDYKKAGLKVGLEIHQQLEGKKLFCSCPAILRDDQPDFTIKRFLKASASELGELDIAALTEQKKELYFLYEGYKDTTCLVELDEEPPHGLNQEALKTTLELALLMKAKIVDEVQVMRKIVVNGSNISGFQRTALIAFSGTLEDHDGEIKIPLICLEEDAAKDIEQTQDYYKFRLDRLGIPLIEIATGPDINNPQQAKRIAERIGMYLRSTGKVKRGLGTIRQDLNISIAAGSRIEIKGAQDLKLIPFWIENEAKRQLSLIEIKNELSKRKIKKNDIKKEFTDITKLLKNSDSKIIKSAFSKPEPLILAMKLPKFKGLIGKELQPNKRLGTEFSDYAKVLAGVSGLVHSDELPAFGITQEEKESIAKNLKCNKEDAFLFVADTKKKTTKTLEEVYERALKTFDGVPQEVRKPNPDGTTSFLRPIPGASRMYPETDVKPIKITKELLAEIKIPELLTEKAERLESEFNISPDLARELAKKNIYFGSYVKIYKNLTPSFIASFLIQFPKEAKTRFDTEIDLKEEQYNEILSLINGKKLPKDVAVDVLIDMQKTGKINLDKYRAIDEKELEKILREIIAKNKGASLNALMGIAMKHLKGKGDAAKIAEKLKILS